MRNYVLPIVAVVVLSTAAPAMACDSGGLISMQRALAVATDLGLVTVSHTQFAGDEWQIEYGSRRRCAHRRGPQRRQVGRRERWPTSAAESWSPARIS